MDILKVGTDFSGLGSPEEALKRLGIEHSIEFACERDKYARQSYLANHSPKVFYDDVTTRDNSKAGYVDMYVFGFPCQAFSMAGKRLGFQETRGTLFFNSLDYINQNRPRVFIAENVKGLLSHDKKKGSKGKFGNTFNTIIDCLALTANGQYNLHKYDDCVNYHVVYAVLNTKNYGIPQNRERIFIVGFRDEKDAVNYATPKGFELRLKLKDMLQDNPDSKYYLSRTALSRLERCKYSMPQINPEITGTINTKNNSPQLSYDSGTTLILDVDDKYNCSENQLKRITDKGIESGELYPDEVNIISDRGHAGAYIVSQDICPALSSRAGCSHDNHIVYPVDEKYYLSDKMLAGLLAATDKHKEKGNGFKFEPTDGSGIAQCLTARYFKMAPTDVYIKEATKQGYAVAADGDSINLSNPNSLTRRGRVGVGVANTLDTACNQAVVVELILFGNIESKNAMNSRVYDIDGLAPTILSAQGGGAEPPKLFNGYRIRRLTPRECFRLMGYTDTFFDNCQAIQSDTQLYKQAGNSIVVDTILGVINNILKALKHENTI